MSEKNTHGHQANRLIESTSPYLLQHAYNPVDWYPWGNEALEKAKKEDKPIIVSIGYSACHWCHVMERESFENDSIATVMNDNFICIKVDREERPDVDQVYMDAVQAMGLNGGWPLNVFLTPDQKPFYGGTYFPPQQWVKLLENVTKAFTDKRSEIEKSAGDLTNALATSEVIKYQLTGTDTDFQATSLSKMFQSLRKKFDPEYGGFNRAPKFPMPGIWLFLMHYYHYTQDAEALEQLTITLDQIAMGGIFDQIGGGWARYSTDAEWLAPHFEKMLYDNGQLMSLYSEAYTVTGKKLYKEVVYKTVQWLEREMLDASGGFYAALDADSEGEEGKFYVWNEQEVDQLLGEASPIVKDYYDISSEGNWEDKNILRRTMSDEKFIKKHKIDNDLLEAKLESAERTLLDARSDRVRPGMDDKILSGWNGLMLKGLIDAHRAFNDEKFLLLAKDNADFILENMVRDDQLYRSYKNGEASIPAYLEDYAFVINGLTALYQVTFEEKWLSKALSLTEYVLDHFYDKTEGLFFFTDDSAERLIARKKEVFDNVIPASNSQMAINLYQLGVIYDIEEFKSKASKMVSKMAELTEAETANLSNWGILYGYFATPTAEISIVGPDAQRVQQEFSKKYLPNKVMMGALKESDLPLMKGKYAINGETTIYVCYNKTCKLPVTSVEEAYKQLKKVRK
ncbi:thioredoxin domain-containing protein [Fulvivirga sp. M361]|nr:thioredoxin domain-containing protein [Fulvivirga sp. M361]TRX61888.1 thioredoxin domain-containing protein [Fulvivirga sp. M361]